MDKVFWVISIRIGKELICSLALFQFAEPASLLLIVMFKRNNSGSPSSFLAEVIVFPMLPSLGFSNTLSARSVNYQVSDLYSKLLHLKLIFFFFLKVALPVLFKFFPLSSCSLTFKDYLPLLPISTDLQKWLKFQ